MTNRWLVKTSRVEFPFYADTIEIAKMRIPEAIEITPYTDMSYHEYIDKIKSKSDFLAYDYKGREVYKMPSYNGYILVKISRDKDGDYYDFCQYQRWDCRGCMNPVTWSMSTPQKFCDIFIENVVEKFPQGFVVTPKEIKKLKATRIYNKEGKIYWLDSKGYFYVTKKHDMPNRRNIIEYERFKGNDNAVLVRYDIRTANNPSGNAKIEWFENEQVFKDYYNKVIKETPPYCAQPRYEIKKRGYKKMPPDERKVILRLPYINIDRELAMRTSESSIIRAWMNMCSISWQGNDIQLDDFLMDILKQYKEYKCVKNKKMKGCG